MIVLLFGYPEDCWRPMHCSWPAGSSQALSGRLRKPAQTALTSQTFPSLGSTHRELGARGSRADLLGRRHRTKALPQTVKRSRKGTKRLGSVGDSRGKQKALDGRNGRRLRCRRLVLFLLSFVLCLSILEASAGPQIRYAVVDRVFITCSSAYVSTVRHVGRIRSPPLTLHTFQIATGGQL